MLLCSIVHHICMYSMRQNTIPTSIGQIIESIIMHILNREDRDSSDGYKSCLVAKLNSRLTGR